MPKVLGMSSLLPKLLNSKAASRRLQVPEAWLIEEAQAGRLPHVQAGAVTLFDFEAVESAIIARAKEMPHVLEGQG